VQARLDHPGGDLAGPVAAGVAGDVELGGECIEAALGGALGDVERGGDLGAGGGTAGEGALVAVGGDEGGGGRPLLLVEGDGGLAGRDGGADRRHRPRLHFEAVAADDQGVAVAQAPRPV